MISADGYNPIRWDCQEKGCFNLKARPKIEAFAECFPGKIAFGDVDGIVEINQRILILEWKYEVVELPIGQRLFYERFTRVTPLSSVMIVIGNPETMKVGFMAMMYAGKWSPATGYDPADLDRVKRRLKAWSDWASATPRPAT